MNTVYKHVTYPSTDRQLHLAMNWMPWHRWIHLATWDLDLYILFPQGKARHQRPHFIKTHIFQKSNYLNILIRLRAISTFYKQCFFSWSVQRILKGPTPKLEAGLWWESFMSLIPHKIDSYTQTPLPIYPTAVLQKIVNHNRIASVCTFNFWSRPLTENYVNSYSIRTLLKK